MFGRAARKTTLHIVILSAGTMSTDQCLFLNFVTSLELTKRYTWQQELIEKREIKENRNIMR